MEVGRTAGGGGVDWGAALDEDQRGLGMLLRLAATEAGQAGAEARIPYIFFKKIYSSPARRCAARSRSGWWNNFLQSRK